MQERWSPALVFVVCFGFWILLSGHFEPLILGLGLASAATVALLNRDIEALSEALPATLRFFGYIPWLLKEILVANLQVVRIVLHPKLPIDPVVVRYKAPLSADLALTTLGNSITLTPGTVTLDIEGSELVVHALTPGGADALREGVMARRLARVFEAPGA